jgi:hypothetical protein
MTTLGGRSVNTLMSLFIRSLLTLLGVKTVQIIPVHMVFHHLDQRLIPAVYPAVKHYKEYNKPDYQNNNPQSQ